jgi:argininosuccinate lyase
MGIQKSNSLKNLIIHNMKLWEKGIPTDKQIEHFNVGNDRELDLVLKNMMH